MNSNNAIQPGGEGFILPHDVLVDLLRVVHEVHFVHCKNDVLDAKQVGDEGMSLGLLDDPLPCIHKNNRHIRGGSPSHHVAGVLDMPGSIRDDELALRCREIPVGDVNGNALLPFGTQTIRQKGQIDMLVTTFAGTLLNRF